MIASLLILAVLCCARADTVYLENGNKLEGTITAQNKGEITLDIGYGTVTVKRSDILRIKRAKLQSGTIERREFESGHRVPEGAEKLNELYQEASRQREGVLDMKSRLQSFEDASNEAIDELPRLRENYETASDRLKALSTNSPGYNAAVEELNGIRNQMVIDQNRIDDATAQRREGQKNIQRYSDAFHALDDALNLKENLALARASRGWQAQYFAWLRRELHAMSGEFSQEAVETVTKGGHVIVQAMLNGRVPARLLVDTGASISVLYPSVADELGLSKVPDIGKANIVLGDGHTVQARVVRLDTIAVGRSWVMGSNVALVPTPAPGIDGLLGMSFLQNFIVRVDSANGRLILENLKQDKNAQ